MAKKRRKYLKKIIHFLHTILEFLFKFKKAIGKQAIKEKVLSGSSKVSIKSSNSILNPVNNIIAKSFASLGISITNSTATVIFLSAVVIMSSTVIYEYETNQNSSNPLSEFFSFLSHPFEPLNDLLKNLLPLFDQFNLGNLLNNILPNLIPPNPFINLEDLLNSINSPNNNIIGIGLNNSLFLGVGIGNASLNPEKLTPTENINPTTVSKTPKKSSNKNTNKPSSISNNYDSDNNGEIPTIEFEIPEDYS